VFSEHWESTWALRVACSRTILAPAKHLDRLTDVAAVSSWASVVSYGMTLNTGPYKCGKLNTSTEDLSCTKDPTSCSSEDRLGSRGSIVPTSVYNEEMEFSRYTSPMIDTIHDTHKKLNINSYLFHC